MPKVVAYGPQQVSSNIGTGGGMSSPRNATAVGAGAALSGAARSIGGAGPMKQNLDPDSFGVAPINPQAIGNAIGNLGAGVSQLAQNVEKFKLRVDTVAAEEALVKFEREKNDLFFRPKPEAGNPLAPPGGYFNTEGREAYDKATPFSEELDALRKKYSDEISSEQARTLFDQASNAQITRAKSDVMRHAATQFRAWEVGVKTAGIETALGNAGLYWNDPVRRGEQLHIGRESIIDLGYMRGQSPEEVAAAMTKFNSSFAINTIEAALNENASAAQIALTQNMELLNGVDLANIQTKIDREFKIEKTQQDSNTAVIAATTYLQEYGDADNARTLINERINADIVDPDLLPLVRREAMWQLDMRQRAKSEEREASYETAYDYMLQPNASIDRLIADNPKAWDALSVSQRRQLVAGTAVTTDATQWLAVTSLPPHELAKINASDYAGVFSKSDLDTLAARIADAKEGGVEARLGQTIAAQTTQALQSIIGGKPNDWTSAQQSQADAIHSTINAIVTDASKTKGGKLTNDEYKAILDNFTREYIIADSTGEIVAERQFWRSETDMRINDVPAQDITDITAALRAQGRALTSENIIRAYEKGKRTQGQ